MPREIEARRIPLERDRPGWIVMVKDKARQRGLLLCSIHRMIGIHHRGSPAITDSSHPRPCTGRKTISICRLKREIRSGSDTGYWFTRGITWRPISHKNLKSINQNNQKSDEKKDVYQESSCLSSRNSGYTYYCSSFGVWQKCTEQ